MVPLPHVICLNIHLQTFAIPPVAVTVFHSVSIAFLLQNSVLLIFSVFAFENVTVGQRVRRHVIFRQKQLCKINSVLWFPKLDFFSFFFSSHGKQSNRICFTSEQILKNQSCLRVVSLKTLWLLTILMNEIIVLQMKSLLIASDS